MGLNPWSAFIDSDANAQIAGDVVIPHLMAGTRPTNKLATGFKAVLNELGRGNRIKSAMAH
jgi:hypothetical protein